MKEQIFLCLLLMAASLLCSCSEQRYAAGSIPSYTQMTAGPETAPIRPETASAGPKTASAGPETVPIRPETAPARPETAPIGPETAPVGPEPARPEPEPQKKGLVMIVNGTVLDVAWEDNETVAELLAHAQNETITVNTTIYGGFEQVGSFPRSFSRNDVQMTTGPGDIVLYSGNQLVVFFGSNSWSYTRLGHSNLAVEKLEELLGGESAVIELKYE